MGCTHWISDVPRWLRGDVGSGHRVNDAPWRGVARIYRQLRSAGISPPEARYVITSLLFTGGYSARWEHRPIVRQQGAV